jgi:hypothetical protein
MVLEQVREAKVFCFSKRWRGIRAPMIGRWSGNSGHA